jgi:hypothetical protein
MIRRLIQWLKIAEPIDSQFIVLDTLLTIGAQ